MFHALHFPDVIRRVKQLEALENIKDAIEGCLAVLNERVKITSSSEQEAIVAV